MAWMKSGPVSSSQFGESGFVPDGFWACTAKAATQTMAAQTSFLIIRASGWWDLFRWVGRGEGRAARLFRSVQIHELGAGAIRVIHVELLLAIAADLGSWIVPPLQTVTSLQRLERGIH